jgi:hypothetical protein
MSEDDGLEVRQVRVTSPVSKTANVKRILQRALTAAREQTGKDRIVGVFLVTVTDGGGAGLGYALTIDEAGLVAQAVEAGLEKALSVVKAAAIKPKSA